MTLHIGCKSPFRTNPLPTNLSGKGLFLFLYGIQKAIRITEVRLFTNLSHFPSILYGQSRRIIVSHYAVPTEWQRFSLKCCHSFLLSESQISVLFELFHEVVGYPLCAGKWLKDRLAFTATFVKRAYPVGMRFATPKTDG